MSGIQTNAAAGLTVIAGMEKELASALDQAAGEVARLESLDEEQRAEVYAILGAIQSDSEIHQAIADSIAGRIKSSADA